MVILLNATYIFNTVIIKTPTQFLIELEIAILEFIWNNEKPRIAEIILNNKRTSEGTTIPTSSCTIEQ